MFFSCCKPFAVLLVPCSWLPAPSSQLPVPISQLPVPSSQLPVPSSQLPIPSPGSAARPAFLQPPEIFWELFAPKLKNYSQEGKEPGTCPDPMPGVILCHSSPTGHSATSSRHPQTPEHLPKPGRIYQDFLSPLGLKYK